MIEAKYSEVREIYKETREKHSFVILLENINNTFMEIDIVFTLHFERTCMPRSIHSTQLIKAEHSNSFSFFVCT